jgi:DNA (cytosine-5)-methyltransferase 1
MSDLTLVELFAGIGGFSCAFESVGVKTVAAVEIDANARRVLAKNFPEATLFNDVTEVSGDALRAVGFVPERGIITAGWPCQDISVAGRGNGLAGERSGLFSEILRLLDELRPQWFLLENVPRLLSINGGRDMGTVVGSLVERGYGIAYRVLDAQYFGVPQRRRRIFIVGHLGTTGRTSAEVLFEHQGMHGDSPQGYKPWSASSTEAVSSSGEGCLADEFAVAALTANGVGTCGADDNQAQAGHLIAALRDIHGSLREEHGLNT